MNSMKHILAVLVCLSLYAPLVIAQEPQLATPSRNTTSRDVTIIIRQRRLRFTAPDSVQEVRLEVFNQAGETVYDSGIVTGQELSWALQNASGEAIPGGLYAYTLAIKDANSETPALRRGHLILESGHDRLWVTSEGAIGVEESASGGELTVSSDSVTNVAGARLGRSESSKASKATGFNFFDTPSPGRIAKFDSSLFLINSVISEDPSGRIGVGTTTPGSKLTVSGRIESLEGGIKFPDGTVQMTSAAGSLFQVLHNATLTGNGTGGSPLGVNIPALGLLSSVEHNATLAGNGTSAFPLGVAIPLILNGSTGGSGQLLQIVNADGGGLSSFGGGSGSGMITVGGSNNSVAGNGLLSQGGRGAIGGIGIFSFGGPGDAGGGNGVNAVGGSSQNGAGGNGITAQGGNGPGGDGLAGRFNGDVLITGNVSKGGGSFRIDHPLDPANKYLSHSFVESPDMKNVYDGNVTTDQNGEATITLPDYFEALNRDFRYQLTVIGQFAQAIVASKIKDNRFTIKTDRPGVEVSWQVTGIRQDAYANKHRIPVEEEKSDRERGYYLHPQVFKQPDEKSVEWARNPEMMMLIKRQRQEAELRMLEKKNER